VALNVDGDLWFRTFNASPAPRLRLVCFPHAGGSASFFVPMSAALRPKVEVLAVQYPGRQDRLAEPPITDIDELADCVFAALRDRLDGPLAFFGHSMGALIAYEVAQRMEERGDVMPAILVASGRRAPACTRPEHMQVNLRARSRDEYLTEMVDLLRELRGTSDLVLGDDDVLDSLIPALHADALANESYVFSPRPPLSCPITVFVGDRDRHVRLDEAQAWSEHTTGGFELHVFPGAHFYLNEIPAVTFGRLSEVLAAVT
jgi:pyochelin biosynthetic protein PchC